MVAVVIMIKRHYFILLIIYVWLLLHCTNPFAPKAIKSLKLDQLITDQKTPEDVLTNFKFAYTFKDSTLYSNLVDTLFEFEFYDPNYGSSGADRTFNRDDDLAATGSLFRNFDIIDLTWNSTIYSMIDSTTNTAEISKSFRLSLINQNTTFNITGNAIFTFKRRTKDGIWRIIHWKDNSEY